MCRFIPIGLFLVIQSDRGWLCPDGSVAVSPAVHFDAYCQSFIGQYCRVSALLELESLMSQQNLREAFSESELLVAKQKHQQVQEHLQVRAHIV